MDVLLHACCAPCSIKCVESLREEGIEPTLLWQNPNIHPYTEFVARRDALKKYANDEGLKLIDGGNYGLRQFLDGLANTNLPRCEYCYSLRMDAAASYAKANGFATFTTSLLISPYQNHQLLVQIACEKAQKYGVEFLYRDFRPMFREGQAAARQMGIYMQKYCGCIFSEEERYAKPKPKTI